MNDNEEIVEALKGIKKELGDIGCFLFIFLVIAGIALYMLLNDGSISIVINAHETTHIEQLQKQEAK